MHKRKNIRWNAFFPYFSPFDISWMIISNLLHNMNMCLWIHLLLIFIPFYANMEGMLSWRIMAIAHAMSQAYVYAYKLYYVSLKSIMVYGWFKTMINWYYHVKIEYNSGPIMVLICWATCDTSWVYDEIEHKDMLGLFMVLLMLYNRIWNFWCSYSIFRYHFCKIHFKMVKLVFAWCEMDIVCERYTYFDFTHYRLYSCEIWHSCCYMTCTFDLKMLIPWFLMEK